MIRLLKVTLFVTLCVLITIPVMAQCVTDKELAIYMEKQIPLPNSGFGPMAMTLECDPCKCPTSMSDCYAFMAERERRTEETNRIMRNIQERYFKYGVCK